ncbi:MAG: hypothetical protein V3T86_10835 [Planctomycetota bacterium]
MSLWPIATAAVLLIATAASAQSVEEVRAALNDVTTRSDALDEIARYWEGRDELEPDVRALVATNWRAAWALGTKRVVAQESIDTLARNVHRQLVAGWALARIGRPALDVVLAGLDDPDKEEAMLNVLGQMNPDPAEVAYPLATRALAGNEHARDAIRALAPMGAPLMEILIEREATDDFEMLCCVGTVVFPRLLRLWNSQKGATFEIESAIFDVPYATEFWLSAKAPLHVFDEFASDIAKIGPNAIPTLVRALPAKRACRALAKMGPQARSAVPHLLKHMAAPDAKEIFRALSEIGVSEPDHVKQLMAAVQTHREGDHIRDAMHALLKGDSESGRNALADLVMATPLTGHWFWKVVDHLATTAPELTKSKLGDWVYLRDTEAMYADALALGWGHKAADAERLQERIADLDDRTAAWFIYFVEKHRLEHPALIAAMERWTKHESVSLRAAAVGVLWGWRRCGENDRKWLLALARTKGPHQRSGISALSSVADHDDEVRDILFQLAERKKGATDSHQEIPEAAIDSLRQRQGAFDTATLEKYPKITAEVIAARGHRSDAEFRAALGSILRLDPLPRALALELLRIASSGIRRRGARELRRSGTTDDVAALRRCLLDKNASVRLQAWHAIDAIRTRNARLAGR